MRSGESLTDDFGVFIYKDCHGLPLHRFDDFFGSIFQVICGNHVQTRRIDDTFALLNICSFQSNNKRYFKTYFFDSGDDALGMHGTPAYMAPEMAKGEGYDQPLDAWSFGCVLAHMAVLLPPYVFADVSLMASAMRDLEAASNGTATPGNATMSLLPAEAASARVGVGAGR